MERHRKLASLQYREEYNTMETIAVINQKGGVGKSTTAHALLSGLTLKGYKVLAIDLDAQGNLSHTSGASSTDKTAREVLKGEITAEDAIQRTQSGDIIPGHRGLAGADSFITQTGKEYRLKEAIDSLKGLYDYVIIDTPPALGILAINALTACNKVVIPAQADIYSLQGIGQLNDTIQPVKKYCNPDLRIEGILLTRYSNRAILNRQLAELINQVAESLNTKVFKATIRDAIAVKESQATQQSIFTYAPRAKVTEDYRAFIEEMLQG